MSPFRKSRRRQFGQELTFPVNVPDDMGEKEGTARVSVSCLSLSFSLSLSLSRARSLSPLSSGLSVDYTSCDAKLYC